MKISDKASRAFSIYPAAKAAHLSSHSRRSNSNLNSPPSTEKPYSRGVIATLASPFYPGGLWITKIRMTIVLSTISVNVFINFLQTSFLEIVQDIHHTVEIISEPAFAFGIESGEEIATTLESLETSRFEWISSHLGLPNADGVREGIKSMQSLKSKLVHSRKILTVLTDFLWFAECLLWFFIGYAGVWMLLDFLLGITPYITMTLLGIAIGLNVVTLVWLEKTFSIYGFEVL